MTTIILRLFRKRIPNIRCVTQITVMRHRKFLLASSCDCEIPTHYRGNQRELDLTNHMHGFHWVNLSFRFPSKTHIRYHPHCISLQYLGAWEIQFDSLTVVKLALKSIGSQIYGVISHRDAWDQLWWKTGHILPSQETR